MPVHPADSQPSRDAQPSRRALGAFALAGLAFAAGGAAGGAAGQAMTIHTDFSGLIVGETLVQTPDSAMPAYVARPDAGGRYPAILVVSEVFGVDDYIRDVCRRLAKLGYVAVAPNFFYRAGGPAPVTDVAAIQRIGETATNEQVMGDISAVLAWVRAQPFAANRFGLTGFSWGGAVVWMALERFRDFRAGVAWYGRLSRPGAGQFLGGEPRQWPLDAIGSLRAPVLGLYAGKDAGIPVGDVEEARARLAEFRKRGSELIVYPNAQHGFHADYRTTYDPQAAEDGWARMLDHFDANGLRPGRVRGLFG